MQAYIYQADIHCEHCADAFKRAIRSQGGKPDEDSEYWPQGPYADGGGEADTPQHCGTCGLFLENPLTRDGVAYVHMMLIEHEMAKRGNPDVIALWREFYSDELEESADASD